MFSSLLSVLSVLGMIQIGKDILGTSYFPDFGRCEPYVRSEAIRLVIPQRGGLATFLWHSLGRVSDQEIFVKLIGEPFKVVVSQQNCSERGWHMSDWRLTRDTCCQYRSGTWSIQGDRNFGLTFADSLESAGLRIMTSKEYRTPPTCFPTLTPPRANRDQVERIP